MSTQRREVLLKRMHAGQARVFGDPARLKVAMIARRWGKTDGGMIWVSEGAIAGEPCGWFSPTYKLLDEPWRELCDRLSPIISRKDAQNKRIELHTGGSIDFWSMDKDDAGRGRKYKRVFVDEAGWVRNFDDVFFAAIYPTVTDLRGDVVVAGTPKGRRGFYRLYERATQNEDGMRAFTAKTIDNPYIPRDEVERAQRILTVEQFKQEYEAEPAEDGGNPFGLKAIQAAIEPMGEGPAIAYGVDLARSQDWTVIVGLNEHGQVCEFERFQRDWGATREAVSRAITDRHALIDSTGVGSPVVEDIAAVCPHAKGFVFTQTSKQQIMEGLAAAFQSGEIRITDDPILVNELESFGVEYRDGGRVRYEGPPGMHDDCVCALALAWQCYKQHGGKNAGGAMVAMPTMRARRVNRRGLRGCL